MNEEVIAEFVASDLNFDAVKTITEIRNAYEEFLAITKKKDADPNSVKAKCEATKKKIEKDINDIEALYDYHNNKLEKLPKGSDVHKLYQQTMYNILGGDIRGKFVATHVSDDIDKAYAQTRESFDVYDNKERIGMIKENTDMMKDKFKNLMNF